jgi:hypothetical protein
VQLLASRSAPNEAPSRAGLAVDQGRATGVNPVVALRAE